MQQLVAELVVVEGPDLGRRFRLDSSRVRVGRGRDDDFELGDIAVTRSQLLVEWDSASDCHVLIQHGDSHTAINGIPATRNARVRHRLADGDQVQIGGTVLRYFRRPDQTSGERGP